jgi:hypothetical protein
MNVTQGSILYVEYKGGSTETCPKEIIGYLTQSHTISGGEVWITKERDKRFQANEMRFLLKCDRI